MMQDIGEAIADQVALPDVDSYEERVNAIVAFLNEQGYLARWEKQDGGGYLIHIANCPYEQVAAEHHEVCIMDMALMTRLLGAKPERIKWFAKNGHQCLYAIHPPSD